MPYFDLDNLNDADATLEDYLEIAADIVQRLAPTPNPPPSPDTYSPMAARAERLLVNWFKETSGGAIRSEGISGISSSYAGLPEVQALVAGAMGSYYKAPGAKLGRLRSVDLGRA